MIRNSSKILGIKKRVDFPKFQIWQGSHCRYAGSKFDISETKFWSLRKSRNCQSRNIGSKRVTSVAIWQVASDLHRAVGLGRLSMSSVYREIRSYRIHTYLYLKLKGCCHFRRRRKSSKWANNRIKTSFAIFTNNSDIGYDIKNQSHCIYNRGWNISIDYRIFSNFIFFPLL